MTIYLAGFPASLNKRPSKSLDTIMIEWAVQSGVTRQLVAHTIVFSMRR